ncbi:MAG: hypothetical protein KDK99_14465 [Verrucomicrobiales bacterium]|nr:hypothetical protein [Verrucomicrobiales bacterium]
MKRVLCLLALPFSFLRADVTLPAIFSDHMVLQQGTEAAIWGWAEPGEKITLTVAGQTREATAGKDGSWSARLPKLPPGPVGTLTVAGATTHTIEDVLAGEVWLGSGQSNMAMTVSAAKDYEAEQAKANLPQIRHFRENSASSPTPQRIGKGEWVVCAPDTVGRFSAALFFFGRPLHRALQEPVGLINSSVGGTPIEAWIDADTQRSVPELKPFFDVAAAATQRMTSPEAISQYEKQLAAWEKRAAAAKKAKQPAPKKPRDPREVAARKADIGGLFNGKIAPLIPYTIAGALWYQGEANSMPDKAPFYQYQLPLLVMDWRERWGYDFPFAWAQLPNYNAPDRDWPTMREAFLKTLSLPRTGMGINIDIGDSSNIHPKNKQEVGRRLALWALGSIYGKEVPSTSGPLPAGHTVQGSEIIVKFDHADGGLQAKDGPLTGFVIADSSQKWHPATARIEGDSVILSSPKVGHPAAVRYAWENDPKCNLTNGAGLPATPFRTDEW